MEERRRGEIHASLVRETRTLRELDDCHLSSLVSLCHSVRVLIPAQYISLNGVLCPTRMRYYIPYSERHRST